MLNEAVHHQPRWKEMLPKPGQPERAREVTPAVRSVLAEVDELNTRAKFQMHAAEAEAIGMRNAAMRASDRLAEANAATMA